MVTTITEAADKRNAARAQLEDLLAHSRIQPTMIASILRCAGDMAFFGMRYGEAMERERIIKSLKL